MLALLALVGEPTEEVFVNNGGTSFLSNFTSGFVSDFVSRVNYQELKSKILQIYKIRH